MASIKPSIYIGLGGSGILAVSYKLVDALQSMHTLTNRKLMT